MRQMKKDGQIVEVVRHIILRNLWEIYVMEDFDESGIGFGLVAGFDDEMGNISIDEYRPYILSDISGGKLYDDLLPAPGWSWVN